ncbi:MAG: peptidoglycan DD-metalloendopeptidase family protein [Cyanobacteriota bacterium]|nr:peptidoglycan DD-metalloendopeptidase family protein [Cyanobacteriota bacterium]
MKRVIPSQVNPAPAYEADANITDEQLKPSSAEGHRRVCSSVAKIGLALSVGASSILIPGQSDSAVAADRDAAKSPATFAPSAKANKAKAMTPAVKSVETSTDFASSNVPTHVVASGETLWQIAQIYQVEANAIAQMNGIGVDAVLEVGQVLEVPTDAQTSSGFELTEPTSPSVETVESSEPSVDFKLSKPIPETESRIGKIQTPSPALSSSELATSAPTTSVEFDKRLETERPTSLSTENSIRSEASIGLETEQPIGLPQKTVSTFASSATHPNFRSRLNASIHRVRDGESIYEIARQYNVSVKDLADANGLNDPSFIRVGEQIDIPPGATLTPQTSLVVFGNKVNSKSSDRSEKVSTLSVAEDSQVRVPLELSEMDNLTVGDEVEVPNFVANRSQKNLDETDTESWVTLGESSSEPAQRLAAKLKPGAQNHASASADTREYVEELRAGIDKLRAKHRVRRDSTPIASVSETVETQSSEESISSARQINPEFAPEQHTAALQTEGLQPWSQSHTQVEAIAEAEEFVMAAVPEIEAENDKIARESEAPAEDAEVAVAPLGSANYAPIDPPRMVSPELPSLSAPQAYLPKVQPGTLSPGIQDFSGAYTWPAQGELSSGYGWRWGRMHQGIDIAGPVGTPIVAAAPGKVTYSRWNSGGYGNLVEITHPDGSITLYAHNSRLLVNEGEDVEQGQQIAEMGSTGFSTGPHLHFELHPAGVGAVDPMAYLP